LVVFASFLPLLHRGRVWLPRDPSRSDVYRSSALAV